jgi:hypothetical protein
MRDISSKTCVTFRERTTEEDYVYIARGGTGCYSSSVGKVGGRQILSLQNNSTGEFCLSFGISQHELLHALGTWHEQSRPDRDTYVGVQKENILPDESHNFEKRPGATEDPYDYGSLMHYSERAFSRNGLPTLTIRRPLPAHVTKVGQRIGISSLDVTKLNRLYGCGSRVVAGNSNNLNSFFNLLFRRMS